MSDSHLTLGSYPGRLIVLSGPSGAGKNTLTDYARDKCPQLGRPVSWTTRDLRPGEEAGVHYTQVSEAEFEAAVAAGLMAEHNNYGGGGRYGTPRSEIEPGLEAGEVMLGDLDLNGFAQLKAHYGVAVVHVQVVVPMTNLRQLATSEAEVVDAMIPTLRERLERRDPPLSPDQLKRRLETGRSELFRMYRPPFRGWCEHRIVNDDEERACREFVAEVIEPILASRTVSAP